MMNNDKKKYVFRMSDGIKFCREKKILKRYRKGTKKLGKHALLHKLFRESLADEVTLEKKPEVKGISHMVI